MRPEAKVIKLGLCDRRMLRPMQSLHSALRTPQPRCRTWAHGRARRYCAVVRIGSYWQLSLSWAALPMQGMAGLAPPYGTLHAAGSGQDNCWGDFIATAQ